MSDPNRLDKIVNYLPDLSKKIPTEDSKFLFFFPPEKVNDKFLFGLSFKTGVLIFAVLTLIQAISSFLDIFNPRNFWLFIVAIFAFCFYCVIAIYAFLSTWRENYSYARISYLLIAVLFLIMALRYICKSIVKIIDFITPWDGDFLRLDFLVYIFGYGLYLFIYLYFIYILYRYMVQIKENDRRENMNIEIKNEDEEINYNENKEE